MNEAGIIVQSSLRMSFALHLFWTLHFSNPSVPLLTYKHLHYEGNLTLHSAVIISVTFWNYLKAPTDTLVLGIICFLVFFGVICFFLSLLQLTHLVLFPWPKRVCGTWIILNLYPDSGCHIHKNIFLFCVGQHSVVISQLGSNFSAWVFPGASVASIVQRQSG